MSKFSTLIVFGFFLSIIASSCKQHQDARKPISQTSGSFMKKSIARNKKLVASEETEIEALIKSNPNVKYIASKKGYWYTYETKNEIDSLTPKKGDVAFFDYEIKDLKGAVIYSELELRPQIYYVDKQNIMMGLRDGIKLMRKNEKVSFLFPSNMGYGYHGDDKKIGTNQPLICTVTLRDFKSEAVYKKESEAQLKAIPAPAKQETKAVIKPKDTITQ
ncbi:MAG: gliding motility-associated peptidyl-prolyl isomerase GldI [Bacteroidota bacterium]|uniref:gliding motility-associated peptidyl-prolyl isomerase GldI n=1 Tax=Flavobacterium sp. XS2P24 TaxID=3041249 RepID=UPI0024A88C3C|nr:gliding motility-associated peptidyl-prolyl isomerase GldI [Flavobacterium sp. XS2P24]MDI6049988.1 gliding motility-associated peptidyl-prolyl isomerase GldI [Flavobacterium sp. XS2P24]